jgi:hypothetical protein
MFDALIRSYRPRRHLLIEVKISDDPVFCRMAVGQLLDYRRMLTKPVKPDTIDLAVLFRKRPRPHAQAFLDDVGVRTLWLSRDKKRVRGDVRIST